MGVGMKTMANTVAVFGMKSFVYGIVAENKKPLSGQPQISRGADHIICKYPSDPTVVLGFLSIASLAVSVLVGCYSVFYPYKGKSVPRYVFFRSMSFFVFFLITVALSFLAAGMLSWVTITELLHLTNNVHKDMNTTCPTAKSGLLGGAALMALNASLFWLICLMLADDVRTDYFEEQDDSRAQVFSTDYNAKQQSKV
ncbi:uncharacterized protein LOC111274343 isoform X1 [Durio zibethinus]|uniref:Uncharacterized protein LOC111274343 isoform X1 n=1 Tax=Durio zibethinus TaxID=66656 RepID=A0A6P5WGW4_DURZI|nr:uncharacterized protein LOC111274343 isoform X1 [Durio zibethinus]XP_022714652.1 uncharacterized protein LOC111274343 isoform X1 [Durio zibethinus]